MPSSFLSKANNLDINHIITTSNNDFGLQSLRSNELSLSSGPKTKGLNIDITKFN